MSGYEAFKSFAASTSYTDTNHQADYNETYTIYNHKPGSRDHLNSTQDVYYPLYSVSNMYIPQMASELRSIVRTVILIKCMKPSNRLCFNYGSLNFVQEYQDDYNTVLWQRHRLWIDIETGKDYQNDIFLHCGEIIEYWTNGYWTSVWHIDWILEKREILSLHYNTDSIYLCRFKQMMKESAVNMLNNREWCKS
eukprot:752565_1